jgi:long-chain acyl-CoA synthetase
MGSAVTYAPKTISGNVARLELDNLERFGLYTRLYYEDRTYTNGEELAYAGKLAAILKSRGVEKGDRVLVMLPNSPELTALFQAVWSIGAIIAPIMPNWTAKEVCAVISNAEPSCVVTIPQLAPLLGGALAGIGCAARLLVFGAADTPEAENIVPDLPSAIPISSPVDRSGTDYALLLYTSGTTASPKGATLTHDNIFAALDSAFRKNGELPRGPMLHVLPLSHSFGLLLLEFANGWGFENVLMRQFDPLAVFQTIERHRVKYLQVVPTMIVYLLNHPERERFDLSSLRRIISGGAALPEALRVAFEQAINCRVEQGYGLSETLALTTGYAPDEPYRSGSAGKPAPGVEIKIIDEENVSLPPDAPGEICIFGRHVMHGYWRDPDATNQAFAGNWFRTGDIGYLDGDGYLYITDRKKDLIIKGGENISPREIEEAIHLHPAVAAAVVVGIPDNLFGENICAVVQLRPGHHTTEDEIRAHVSHHVTRFKVPGKVLFWQELPRSFTGKVSKRDVRDRLRESALP